MKRIMVVGSGPVVIGQAAEFDYSGVQACKVLLEEGYEVVLVNSNPATIMTDPEFATRTYVEPLLPGPVAAIIEKERPDALLPTLGGQTALNLAMDLSADGTLEKFGVELIGANRDAIIRGEDREVFRQVMTEAGIRIPWSITVESVEQALKELDEGDASLPAIIRPAFTMGGQGGGIAETRDELIEVVSKGIAASPIGQVLVEESVIGWGEFELEVMRDRNDNVVIICSIENVDPMGVHTGDSITVAPAQSLTDPVYQSLRDIAIAVIREVGVETGGSNVQFAVNPADGEIVVIEMNPRVSRSSALASKATGFPIAKIAAKLAVGYALEEIPNDITRATPASFEPTIDYVVTKIPRFAFEKFPGADEKLSTYMQSVGEVMSIGRTFRESFAKALASRELDSRPEVPESDNGLLNAIATPTPGRIDLVLAAFERGLTVEQVHEQAKIDPWFLRELELLATDGDGTGGLERIYNSVDTCAAEFEAATPYYYSSHEPEGSPSEIRRGEKESVVILGAGPNRIGQGIEFDYCCVHAAMTARECGRDAVMVNCNPETVSTDYDTSDRLYFEPLTLEHVLAVCEKEQPEGVIVMFGGQTPLKLAEGLKEAGINLLGTPVEAIDAAEDRGKFGALIDRLGIKPPPYGTALSAAEAEEIAAGIGYPLLVRPSFVLGGRAMEICYSTGDLKAYLDRHVKASPEHPLLLDRFLENAIEVDVDALCDGEEVFVAGIMQHVEEAGVHSGDSACVLPPMSIGQEMIDEIKQATTAIALELGVIGLINIQYALAGGELYVIEANPRASRTVPFVSKAIGIPLAKVATRIMLGQKLADQDLPEFTGDHVSVKEAVLP
ncbi:MAG TPA: carbamoyl-phosphate synthase large subunit, partial [Solirubrobacterales bacterium]|nr:carbamoyl-phosphate synthase large subunit [Solirubrobacterales bacterium]